MINTPDVSVIVPVYNVEKWLRKCVDSILSQTYVDFELILINDGSKDRSLEICREYELTDDRVKVIDGPNRGSSAARNTGLEQAKGQWIIFCDSDDWWDQELLEKLHTTAIENNADIAACDIVWEYSDNRVIEGYAYGPFESDAEKGYVGTVYCSLCNKLIKGELYERYNIKGSSGIKMWDDVLITAKLRYYSLRTVIIREPLYHYNRMVETSQIQTFNNSNDRYPSEQIYVTKQIEDYFRSQNLYNSVAEGIVCGCQAFLYDQVSGFANWRKEFSKPAFNYQVIKRLFPSKKQRVKHVMKIVIPLWLCKYMVSFEAVLRCHRSAKK